MRNKMFVSVLLVLSAQFALAGAGNDQPTNIVITTPYSDNINWAQVCWNTAQQSDSMLLIGGNADFSRQIYDSTLTKNHCVVVQNLQPNTQYYYSAASCTDPVGGKPCARTDPNWSSAPWPDKATFKTAPSTAGPLGFNAFAFGPDYVYQNSGINIGVSLIQTGGIATGHDVMMLTQASIDGQSCLPGGLLGATCGDTNISFTLVCDDAREEVNPATNNYPVWIYHGGAYVNDYVCWNSFFNEPAAEARIVPLGQQRRPGASRRSDNSSHNLSITFQIVDYTTNAPVSNPETVTWQFSVLPPAQFTVTPPTSFPPIPNYNTAIATSARWATSECEVLKAGNQQGVFLNMDLWEEPSLEDPWDIYTFDGNRIFKEAGDRFDGVTGDSWQPHHAYNPGDVIALNGYNEVVVQAGNTGDFTVNFSSQPGALTNDNGTLVWVNAGNKAYWNACSGVLGTQYMNWAVNIPKFGSSAEWNVFPWGTYMDFLRQGDTLNENCDGGPTCSGLNAAGNLRLTANILTYPAPGYNDQFFANTYYRNQVGTVRALPFNTNLTLVDWLETGVEPTNELQRRVDLLLQTVSEAIKYNPLEDGSHYVCCYSPPNWTVGLWAMTLIHAYDVEQYMNTVPDARIPIELMKLLDWFYSTQFNLLGNDYTFPYQPWSVPYNCSVFGKGKSSKSETEGCWNPGWVKNDLIAPAYAWLGAVYGDTCKLPTSGVECWTAADKFFANAWQRYDFGGDYRDFNVLFQDFNNYVGWRSGAFPGTDSYVLPTHNPLEGPYPDVIGPYPAGQFPAKPLASNISGSGATITWYTYEQAVSTVVEAGTDPNNLNMETDCGPSVYTGTDNLWVNTCTISGLQPGTQYYFGVGGTDAASNFAFSGIDPTQNLLGYLSFITTQ
jgi:hypothetical protein